VQKMSISTLKLGGIKSGDKEKKQSMGTISGVQFSARKQDLVMTLKLGDKREISVLGFVSSLTWDRCRKGDDNKAQTKMGRG